MIPHCDLATGKIYGCIKGSNRWWHEKGHFEFNKLESTSRLILLQAYAFKYWMLFTTFTTLIILIMVRINNWIKYIFLVPALITFLIYWWLDIYEEWWCDKYALNKGTLV